MTNHEDLRKALDLWGDEMHKAASVCEEDGAPVGIIDGNRAIADSCHAGARCIESLAARIADLEAERDAAMARCAEARVSVLRELRKWVATTTHGTPSSVYTNYLFREIDRLLAAAPPAETQPRFGAPGVRDPEFPCDQFDPGMPEIGNTCETDGHYLCQECGRRRLPDDEAQPQEPKP